jgi:glycosyltransferase involved in cell wall biosynthesis
VVFAPHGLPVSDNAQIEVDFDLVKRRRQLNRIIVVGDNYRDLDMLSRIVSARGERSVSIHLLGFSKQAKSRFLNLPGVVVVERLSAADFNEYIVESFTLLLPLTFATANNALLEAHVAGIPSICSRIDGVSDYATSDTKLFTEDGQYWAEFDALWSLGDGEYAAKCAAIRREAVDKFSWEKVRSMLKSVY